MGPLGGRLDLVVGRVHEDVADDLSVADPSEADQRIARRVSLPGHLDEPREIEVAIPVEVVDHRTDVGVPVAEPSACSMRDLSSSRSAADTSVSTIMRTSGS